MVCRNVEQCGGTFRSRGGGARSGSRCAARCAEPSPRSAEQPSGATRGAPSRGQHTQKRNFSREMSALRTLSADGSPPQQEEQEQEEQQEEEQQQERGPGPRGRAARREGAPNRGQRTQRRIFSREMSALGALSADGSPQQQQQDRVAGRRGAVRRGQNRDAPTNEKTPCKQGIRGPDVAGVPGLEPRTTEPESAVLPITPYPNGQNRSSGTREDFTR